MYVILRNDTVVADELCYDDRAEAYARAQELNMQDYADKLVLFELQRDLWRGAPMALPAIPLPGTPYSVGSAGTTSGSRT